MQVAVERRPHLHASGDLWLHFRLAADRYLPCKPGGVRHLFDDVSSCCCFASLTSNALLLARALWLVHLDTSQHKRAIRRTHSELYVIRSVIRIACGVQEFKRGLPCLLKLPAYVPTLLPTLGLA